jgi:hypothetical protein
LTRTAAGGVISSALEITGVRVAQQLGRVERRDFTRQTTDLSFPVIDLEGMIDDH